VRLDGFMSCSFGQGFGGVTVQRWNRDRQILAQNPSIVS